MSDEGDRPDEEAPTANVVRVDFKRAQRTSPSDPLAPQKYAVFSRFVARGKVMVTLDARRVGVSVPRHLADEPQLNLDFSERFGLPDFVYDERGVRASLSFKGQPFFCDVPWSSVYALFSHADNERLTWASALPQEILEQLPEASVEHLERVLALQVERLLRQTREQKEKELRSEGPKSVEGRRRGLRGVPADERGPSEADKPDAPSSSADGAGVEEEPVGSPAVDADGAAADASAADAPADGSAADESAADGAEPDEGPSDDPPPRGPGLRLVKS